MGRGSIFPKDTSRSKALWQERHLLISGGTIRDKGAMRVTKRRDKILLRNRSGVERTRGSQEHRLMGPGHCYWHQGLLRGRAPALYPQAAPLVSVVGADNEITRIVT